MAHHKSAKKRIRGNEKKRSVNRTYLSAVRSAIKKFRKAMTPSADGKFDQAGAVALFGQAQSLIAKAAAKGMLHRNNASRKIGRLSHLLSNQQNPAAVAEKAAAAKAKPAKKSDKASSPAKAKVKSKTAPKAATKKPSKKK